MQVPLELSYHNIEGSPWLDAYVEERAAHLETMCGGITSCRVVVEQSQNQHTKGNPFRVRVEVTMPPQKDLIGDKEGVVEDTHVQLRPLIRQAFDAVEKQAKKQRERMRGDVKRHHGPESLSAATSQPQPTGLVMRLFREEGYGFLKVPKDNEEYYFHRNAVLHDDFERLEPGVQVRFEPSLGEEGPQASTVQLIGKAGKGEHSAEDQNATARLAGWQ